MKKYYYVHTGHRIGLDRFRRSVALLKALQDDQITLLTSDFRIAHIARDFGIKQSVGIDVVRNIPQIAHAGDILIFDSDEANEIMLEDMKEYFSTFIQIPNDEVIVDTKYFAMQKQQKSVPITYFFGDDDYEKDLQKHFDFIEDIDPALMLGFYYFLDYEEMLKEKFSSVYEFEEYDEMIASTNILLTASPQAVLDSLASGGKPIYFQREDYPKDFIKIFESFGVPIVNNYKKDELNHILDTIDLRNYQINELNSNKIENVIKDSLNL